MSWFVILMLFVMAVVDLKKREIPVWPVVLLGAVLFGFRVYCGVEWPDLLCGLLPGAVIYLVAVMSHEKIGKGDALVVLALGLGYPWSEVCGRLFMALVLAAVCSLGMIVFHKAGRKTELPFLPFLCAGCVICSWM